MKTKLTEALGRVGYLFRAAMWLGAFILICSGASAQNMLVSGSSSAGGEIFKFSLDGKQSIFASGLDYPGDLAVDGAANVFVVDRVCGELDCDTVIYKMSGPNEWGYFASGLKYPSYLAVDRAANLFVADYSNGIIYQYKPSGSRATFASGLYHPVGMALDSAGSLYVADNSIGNIYQGGIYKYKPDGSRVTIAVLNPGDRPADLALDSMGNLFMADLGGNIYRFALGGVLRRYIRTTFGSVPNSAQSLAFDSAGNLFVVDVGDVNGNANAIYKFTTQGVRSAFASVDGVGQRFWYLAFQPSCCQ